jgi:hypothetical protein
MHYRARTYDPAVGRFISRDPVRASNLYEYVGSSPLGRVDPLGLEWAPGEHHWFPQAFSSAWKQLFGDAFDLHDFVTKMSGAAHEEIHFGVEGKYNDDLKNLIQKAVGGDLKEGAIVKDAKKLASAKTEILEYILGRMKGKFALEELKRYHGSEQTMMKFLKFLASQPLGKSGGMLRALQEAYESGTVGRAAAAGGKGAGKIGGFIKGLGIALIIELALNSDSYAEEFEREGIGGVAIKMVGNQTFRSEGEAAAEWTACTATDLANRIGEQMKQAQGTGLRRILPPDLERFMVDEYIPQGEAAWKDMPEPAKKFLQDYAPLWMEQRLRSRR